MTDQRDLFEMRRLEALSNTIFGVAMTLLAYDLPRAGQFAGVPGWTELFGAYRARLIALMLSFIIAGLFWISHHRRLALAPHGTRGTVFINLLFLMSIIILPATNSLYGAFSDSSMIVVIYGAHLTMISALNALLWVRAVGLHARPELVSAATGVAIFVCGTAVATVSPSAARYVWYLAFGTPVLAYILGRRTRRAALETSR
ncbi:MAG: TMEM175 family protein [Xanthobacteraceae bacterium]|nr:TMEM175 family protein [Xanthobacteraceae bacterium]